MEQFPAHKRRAMLTILNFSMPCDNNVLPSSICLPAKSKHCWQTGMLSIYWILCLRFSVVSVRRKTWHDFNVPTMFLMNIEVGIPRHSLEKLLILPADFVNSPEISAISEYVRISAFLLRQTSNSVIVIVGNLINSLKQDQKPRFHYPKIVIVTNKLQTF